MFEAVSNITPKAPEAVMPPAQVISFRTPETSGEMNAYAAEHPSRAAQKAEAEKRVKENPQVTEEMLSELERDIETIHSIGLKFSKHSETGRTMIKVMDKQNEKLIREIPSEEVLNLAAKIEEMIGILFDKKV
jgi:flagellar protein FlaG